MKKLILLGLFLGAFGASAANVNLGQANASGVLDSVALVGAVAVGDDLLNTGASIGNTGAITIDATAAVGSLQANAVGFQSADAHVRWAGVDGVIENTAASIGNNLTVDIDECGACSDSASVVNSAQLNATLSNTAFASVGLAGLTGSLTNTAAAIGNSATITITN